MTDRTAGGAAGPARTNDAAAAADGAFDARLIRAVTFDFGDTLVPVSASVFWGIVSTVAADACAHLDLGDPDRFLAAWADERDRQIREDVAEGREMDMGRRFARVIARSRGVAPPPPDVRWDDAAIDAVAAPREVTWALEAYRDRWVAGIQVPADVTPVLARIAETRVVGILSNWPHAPVIEAFVDRAGWRPFLSAIVISSEVGAIKPDAAIFRAAEVALGWPDGAPAGSILHVGDDRRADVAGARRAGWRAAWLRRANPGSPLPGAGRPPDPDDPPADVEIDDLGDLVDLLAEPPAPG